MKSRNKEHKQHENIIGKIIYGFLLFMPLLAIGVTCAYAIFNKNAYQSYYGETINEEKIETPTNINENTTYYLNWNNLTSFTQSPAVRLYIDNFEIVNRGNMSQTTYDYLISVKDNINYLVVTQYNSLPNIQFGGDNVNTTNLTSTNWEFTFNIQSYTGNFNISDLRYIEYNSFSFVSEVFYYSIDKVQESPLFNWAENSAIYTGMTTTCNALNITTPFIPLLMTYWLIISVIYILYDIILVILHIFHKKIHQLEDSF